MERLREWIRIGKERGASDLLLESGTPVVYRIRGELVTSGEAVSADGVREAARGLLDSDQWESYQEKHSYDLSRTLSGVRCRINLFQTVRGQALAIRLLTSFQNNIKDSNLHPDLKKLAGFKTGLVLISGPTGSGKSTTLAALLEELNGTERKHVITIESPIEYFFTNRKSLIRQREIPTHSPSFEQAIVDSMRESPDVLVIGEMRTQEVMRLTLNAAETGHLVLATVHSSSCAEALSRVCMSFPAEQQRSIQAQLADCLVGVVCQRLEYNPQLEIRIPQCEILMANTSAKSNIRTGQFSQLASVIQVGGEDGMWSFERYQRWIEQKKDWVRPSQAPRLQDTEIEPSSRVQAPVTSRKQLASKSSATPLKEGRIEINIADEDLESLAKKISKHDDD